ncbi:MAG TPA: bifunctional [glutamine synthetase] adenylyltransferase/[glutamine synthetase]-adenylyl-L-tyrosine phosphorylase [Devosia sp.]|nr:bifunctional [glutamine synthetase] adenylyltransferase/[glutamine synthetase]-adenylyl-L-tyrosine phosphorylase [Devosia sp.]
MSPSAAACEERSTRLSQAMAVSIETVLASAPYLGRLASELGAWWEEVREHDPKTVVAELLGQVAPDTSRPSADVATELRLLKQKIALLVGTGEVTGRITPAESTAALSDLADVALNAGLAALIGEAIGKGQFAAGTTAANCGLAIFALGKHGGRELNYSSDIDIVAFYDPQRAPLTEPGEAGKVFTRIVQRLAALTQERAGDAYVFRTDLRLRPDPGSTPVALSIDAALAYYESRGQNWERAAWIKARPCAGDLGVGEAFLDELAPYVWRKHLDLATIADIQAMKRQINVAKGVGEARVAGHNVKLGRGGIREIEFFVQTQQLIAGGRDKSLRVRPTTQALAALASAGWISQRAAGQLTETYWFLRAVENRLQMLRDEQTHTMPENPAELSTVALLMGFASLGEFESSYLAALNRVQGYYAELFTEGTPLGAEGGDLVFTGTDDDPATLDTLARMGFADPAKVSATVRKWHYGGYRATRAAAARAHLTELLPALLSTIAETGGADDAFARFDDFLSRLPSGIQLFALLRNYADLRALLVQLMASAPRMAEAVIHRAHVMDALIDPAFADEVSRPAVLVAKVDAFLGEARDFQEVIDRARIIGQEQQFLIAAALLSGTVTAERAGEQFTALAETLLRTLFAAVRAEFEKRHGVVPGARAGLLAFGKMASREMTAASDLDFIMLYQTQGTEDSNGEKPLPASQYFARLTQRLVAAVTAPTSEGVLYAVDLRLRPSGNAGPLATSFPGFVTYHQENAWTWEHLALSRARVAVADGSFDADIGEAIATILARPRDVAKTIDDVVAMRALMAKERQPRHAFDLKLQPGGLIDLEFIAQSAQLVAGKAIALPQATVPRVLARLGALGLLPEADSLIETHRIYATILQTMSAALNDPFKDAGWTTAFRELLAHLTNAPSFERLDADVREMRMEVEAAATAWYARARAL